MPRLPGKISRLSGLLRVASAALKAHFRTSFAGVSRSDDQEVRESGLFDADWYVARHPEVAWAFVDPLRHYLAVGSREGWHPLPLFDPDWYRSNYPDSADVEPLTHFLRKGGAEGRSPSPFFDTHWYRHRNGPFDDEGLNPLIHYLGQGAARRFNPSPRFDTGWYLDEYPEVAQAGVNPLVDYVESGRWLWRSTHPTEPPPGSPVEFFRDFPWSALHEGAALPPGERGYFKLLFIFAAHATESERASGAEFLASLSEVADIETFAITTGGASLLRPTAATLELGEPSLAELDPKTVATRVGQAFRDLAPLSAAVLVGDDAQFRSALEQVGVACVDWAPADGGPDQCGDLLAELAARAGYRPSRPLSVSAVVPVAASPAALEARLRNILEQSRPPAEILVIVADDESNSVAEGLAADSGVGLTVLRADEGEEPSSRQWQMGIEHARGDLVWIAEPDGENEPDFLEQMIPLFFQDAVMLGYAQCRIVEDDDHIAATDHRFLTDEISTTRWGASYRTAGIEEIAVALSQRNTIPSIGTALFRRQTLAALAPFLSDYRFAGDWWMALEMARRGEVRFVARTLGTHRQVAGQEKEASNGEAGALAEILRIKANLFRELDLPSNAIHRSVGASAHDYLLHSWRPGRPVLRFVQHPGAADPLDAIRGRLDARLADVGMLRLLLVDGPDLHTATVAAAQLSPNATSYLLIDEPQGQGGPALDDSLLLEGTRGVAPWAAAQSSGGRQLGPEHRLEVLSELTRFHRIDALVSLGPAGRDLAPRLALRASLPWLVVLTADTPIEEEARRELETSSDGLISTPVRLADALRGEGAVQFLQAVSQAIDRRRDRLRATPNEAQATSASTA